MKGVSLETVKKKGDRQGRIHATPNSKGQYRVFGYAPKEKEGSQRVWIATVNEGESEIFPDTIMKVRDFEGYEEEAFAGDLEFSRIMKNVN
jgi:hypothetical protein